MRRKLRIGLIRCIGRIRNPLNLDARNDVVEECVQGSDANGLLTPTLREELPDDVGGVDHATVARPWPAMTTTSDGEEDDRCATACVPRVARTCPLASVSRSG